MRIATELQKSMFIFAHKITGKDMKNEMKGIFLPLLAALLCACAGHHHHEEAEEHEGHQHGDEIVLNHEAAKAAGIVTEKLVPGTFHGVIHTSGTVMSASCDETTVAATISGRVSQAEHLAEGMPVAVGKSLYSITSNGMMTAEGDPVARARIEYEKARRDYERACDLISDKIISQKDFDVVKTNLETAELTYKSMQKTRSQSGVMVFAPKSGYVKQTLVKDGDYVETGQPLMVLTQNQHLYLRAEVPERYFGEIHQIVSAKFSTSSSKHLYDIADMGGRMLSYGRSSEGTSSYIPVIFEFRNTGDVVQGSFADIYLITGKRTDVLTLPLEAITEEQGIHYAYIKVDEDGYRKQEVTLGQNDGDRVEILTGLQGGELVVVKGVMQVKLASATNVVPAHNHSH